MILMQGVVLLTVCDIFWKITTLFVFLLLKFNTVYIFLDILSEWWRQKVEVWATCPAKWKRGFQGFLRIKSKYFNPWAKIGLATASSGEFSKNCMNCSQGAELPNKALLHSGASIEEAKESLDNVCDCDWSCALLNTHYTCNIHKRGRALILHPWPLSWLFCLTLTYHASSSTFQ